MRLFQPILKLLVKFSFVKSVPIPRVMRGGGGGGSGGGGGGGGGGGPVVVVVEEE